MWVLFVVNTILTDQGGELKWTKFAEYENELSCFVERAILIEDFKNGETAVCYKIE